MIQVPYPRPATKADARENAIYLANQMAQAGAPLPPGVPSLAAQSQTWAMIAYVFGEESSPVFHPDSDVAQLEEHSAVIRPVSPGTHTVTVDSALWDVMRALATRYVLSSLNRVVTLHLDEVLNPAWELRVTWLEGHPEVRITIESAP